MLSFLNSSTLDSDDEKEKNEILPKSDLDLYPPNLDENQLLEIEKLTADSLIDLINNVQQVRFPTSSSEKFVTGQVRTQLGFCHISFGARKPYRKDPPSFDSATRRRITEVNI